MTVSPIDAVQLAALRKSDRIVFRHENGKSQIEAIQTAKPTKADPFAREQVVVIPVLFECHDHGGGGSEEFPSEVKGISYEDANSGNFYGFHMEHSGGKGARMKSILRCLKVRDTLRIHWERGAGTSPAIFKLGVVCDHVQLSVDRADKRKSDIFLIDAHAVPLASAERNRTVRITRGW